VRKIVLAAAATALLWAACCTALAWRSGFPEAGVHDEFSYLLGADTFAHGRLANPPHPLGRFFESPHILVRPSYASKFPPGQSLVLGLGEKLFGSPYYGVLFSGAVMMFLFTMTLVAWTGLVPGLAVSAVLGLQFLPPMYWVYSYWGGCLAAAAGASVLLAFEFHRRHHPIAAGVTFGAGVLTLFVTRAYEGGLFTAAAVVACSFWLYRERGRTAVAGMRAFLISAAPVIVMGLLCVGRYNAAVTGNPFRLPHLLHESQYQTTPLLWFLPVRPEPRYTHPRLAAEHGWNGPEFSAYRVVIAGGYYRTASATLRSLRAIFGWTLALLLLVLFAWRDPRTRLLAAILGVCLIGLSLETFHFPHYAAPVTIAIALLSACATEKSWRSRIGSFPFGAILTCLVFAVACLIPLRAALLAGWNGAEHGTGFPWSRARLIHLLSEVDGDHLVIVRYPYPAWRLGDEWVYNSADIDAQKIVFAHDLGMKENEEILGYYPARRKWLLTFSGDLLHLSPY
jgi:hypothetical protein